MRYFALLWAASILVMGGCSALTSTDDSQLTPEGRDAGRDARMDGRVDGSSDGGGDDADEDAAPDATPDGTPGECAMGCDDGNPCTSDHCAMGACVHDAISCDDGVPCTHDVCGAMGCEHTPDDGLCVSGGCGGFVCNAMSGCVAGPGTTCDDGDPCTVDRCGDAGECERAFLDADGDGAPAERVAGRRCDFGTDCDDANMAIHPFATEACNGVDDDCDGRADEDCMMPTGDSCAAPTALELGDDGTLTVEGDIGTLRDDHATICPARGDGSSRSGPDAVYFLPLAERSDVIIDTIGSDFDTVLAVGTTCSTRGFELGCNQNYSVGTVLSRIFVHQYSPGGSRGSGLFILVDAASATSIGHYVLNVRVVAPSPDSCEGPLDISGGGSVVGFVRAGNAYAGSCQDFGGMLQSESVLSFTGESVDGARFRAYSNDFRPFLYVRDDCDGDDLACVDAMGGSMPYANRAELDVMVTAGTAYTLFVDGALPGPFSDLHYLLLYDP